MAKSTYIDYLKYIDFGYKVDLDNEDEKSTRFKRQHVELFNTSANEPRKIETRIKAAKYLYERLTKIKEVKSSERWKIKLVLHLYYYEDDFGTLVIKYDEYDLIEFKYNLICPIVHWNNLQHEFHIVSRLYSPALENEFNHIELIPNDPTKKGESSRIILDYGLFNMYEILI